MLSELPQVLAASVVKLAQGQPSTININIPNSLPGSSSNPATIGTIVTNLITFGLGVAGALAVLFIIVGGFFYITAQGDTERLEKAKKTIKNAIIGAVFILLSLVIVLTIQAALGGGTTTP
jgi:amino acid transporter